MNYGTNDAGEIRNFEQTLPAKLIKTPSKNANQILGFSQNQRSSQKKDLRTQFSKLIPSASKLDYSPIGDKENISQNNNLRTGNPGLSSFSDANGNFMKQPVVAKVFPPKGKILTLKKVQKMN